MPQIFWNPESGLSVIVLVIQTGSVCCADSAVQSNFKCLESHIPAHIHNTSGHQVKDYNSMSFFSADYILEKQENNCLLVVSRRILKIIHSFLSVFHNWSLTSSV